MSIYIGERKYHLQTCIDEFTEVPLGFSNTPRVCYLIKLKEQKWKFLFFDSKIFLNAVNIAEYLILLFLSTVRKIMFQIFFHCRFS